MLCGNRNRHFFVKTVACGSRKAVNFLKQRHADTAQQVFFTKQYCADTAVYIFFIKQYHADTAQQVFFIKQCCADTAVHNLFIKQWLAVFLTFFNYPFARFVSHEPFLCLSFFNVYLCFYKIFTRVYFTSPCFSIINCIMVSSSTPARCMASIISSRFTLAAKAFSLKRFLMPFSSMPA